MTAAAFLQVLNELVYLAVAVAVVVAAIKLPRRTSIDTALFFTAFALILEVSGLSSHFGFVVPAVLSLALAAMLLALPYIQLRLLDDFVGVGRWVKRSALLGLAIAIGTLVVVPSPMPGLVSFALVIYFVSLLSYCAAHFVRESRRAHGLVAARLSAVAAGSGLIALVLAFAVILPFVLPREVAALVTQLLILAAGICYFVGFAPPSIVKRLWQESALRHFMQEMNRLPEAGSVDEVMRRLEIAAGTATAGSRAVIAVWDEARAVLQFTTADGTAHTVDTRTTVTLGGRVVQERRPLLSEDPAREYPSGAEMYRRLGVKAVVGAPIVVRGHVFGLLAVQSSHPSLFGRDDVDFLGLLADQIGIAVENSQLAAEVRRLTAEERRLGQAARSRLATIVAASPDGIIGTTLDGVVTDWNPAAERMYGYAAEDIVGLNISSVVPPERLDELAGLLDRIRAGESIEQFETERIRKDGTLVNVSLGLAPLRGADGAIDGVASVARDISGRVAAERREADLEARLRQSERLESVGLLAGGIAHDFNNLLAVVLNYAAFIEDKLPDDAELRDDLLQIQRAAERGAVFTRQLLTFAHQRPVNVANLQLNLIIPALQQMLHRSIPENITINVRLAPDLCMVHADAGQIEQLLLNLVVNAGDAMPSGGTLLIETANAQYDDTAAAQMPGLLPGRYVCLTVTDTGEGMSKQVMEHAFEPFFTTKPTGKGTGLGLATVYGITKQAGGLVSIYSEVGRGTSIRTLLPAQTSAAAVATIVAEPVPIKAIDRAGLTILLVEDEPAVRTAATRILRAAGYRLIEASTPAAALDLVTTEAQIDLLVTDMVMPGMSGRDLSRKLHETRPEMSVLYMSGYSEELVMRDSTLDGPLLQKPFTRESLLLIVRAAIDGVVRTKGSPVPIA